MNDFSQAVDWLTTGGSVVVTAWFVSWLLEDFAWWNAIRSQYKKLIILLVSLWIGFGAQFLKLHPEQVAVLKPYLDTAVLVIMAWVATQVAHKVDQLT